MQYLNVCTYRNGIDYFIIGEIFRKIPTVGYRTEVKLNHTQYDFACRGCILLLSGTSVSVYIDIAGQADKGRGG